MVPSYLNHIEEPAHDDSTEEVLEGDEGVRDAQQQGGQLQKKICTIGKYVTLSQP
jgi:hypothetical protein